MIFPQHIKAKVEMQVVAIPKPGISINEAKDKWLAAGPDNRVLDDGGRSDVRLLVGGDRSKTVYYEVMPELCPPGFTVQDAMAHMRKAGWDVRGEGPISSAGNPTVVVVEKY